MQSPLFTLYQSIETLLQEQKVHISARDVQGIMDTYHTAKQSTGKSATPLSPQEAYTYLAYRMPATFSACYQVLSSLPLQQPTSLLDLGAGPSSASWAAAHTFPSLTHIDQVDQNAALLKVGQSLFIKQFPQITLTSAIKNLTSFVPTQSYDLITLSYALNEIPLSQHSMLFNRIWPLCKQALVILEPGHPKGFEIIHNIRQWALEENIPILAPCSHTGACPVYKKDWCHFSVRFERSQRLRQIKKGTLGYEDEAYAYIVLSRDPVALTTKRILRPPQTTPQGVKLTLCAPDSPEIRPVAKKDSLYKKAKKVRWGEEWGE